MSELAHYTSDAEAIRSATKLAKDAARENQTEWQERVLLRSGDTLTITSTPGGRIFRRLSAGWDRNGFLHCGPTATRVGVR